MLKEFMKSKHRDKIGVVVILAAILSAFYFGGGIGMGMLDTTHDLSDYANVYIKDYSSGDLYTMSEGYEIDDASESTITVSVDWTDSATPIYMQAKLYRGTTYGAGVWVETGSEVNTGVGDFKWTFSLANCPSGWSSYYIEVYGYFATTQDGATTHILGQSFIFQILNLERPITDSPEIIESPVDQDAYIYTSVLLTWRYVVSSVSDIDISVNGVSQYSTFTSLAMNGVEQIIQEYISVGDTGIYKVVFSITPMDTSIEDVSETTVLNVGDATTTTTDTETITTRPPPPPPIGYNLYVLIGGVIVVVILGIVMLKRRRESY